MSVKKDADKEWKRMLVACLAGLAKEGVIPTDVKDMTGRLVLDMNMNQGGISDMDVAVKRKYK
jgi:hypothetical protein